MVSTDVLNNESTIPLEKGRRIPNELVWDAGNSQELHTVEVRKAPSESLNLDPNVLKQTRNEIRAAVRIGSLALAFLLLREVASRGR